MKAHTVAILESRMGSQLAELIAKRGGTPIAAPALAEIPDIDEAFLREFIGGLESKPAKAAVFQTGVGTRALFGAADRLGLTAKLLRMLEPMVVVARGPKPGGVLRSRGVHIDFTAGEPFTTDEVLGAMKGIALKGERVMVQRYGASNRKLDEALEREGASVIEVPTYKWAMPQDVSPLVRLIEALGRGEIAATVFTNAEQVHNLFRVAEREGRAGSLAADLGRTVVASIGPICSAALKQHGVAIALEPHPPKLGPLVEALDERLSR